ncbi:MAG: putative metal-dependent hydrolase [halophilic archaeon J07HB67]|jgi:Predicted metal-dependent hydrolase of the TIM-barrel fold|nr:MAG: putative metal-dependent hydrolase [halophilic archaeon J07HB67]
MLELEHSFRVTDVSARLDPDEESVATVGRDVTPETLQREFRQAGVVRGVVTPGRRPADEGYVRANNAVARLSVDRPFVPFARLNGPRDPSETTAARLRNFAVSPESHHVDPEDAERYAYDDRFAGFSLDPATDGLPTEDVFAVIEDADAPVCVTAGERFPPSTVADTLLSYDFPVVLSSFGGFPLNRGLMHDAVDLLDEFDELYLDTAFVRYRGLLERGLLEHPDRIVFGSGAPDSHPNVGVMEVLTLDLSEDHFRRVFEKNPTRVVPELGVGDG